MLQNRDEAKHIVCCIFKEYGASNYWKMLGLDCNAESMRVFREMFWLLQNMRSIHQGQVYREAFTLICVHFAREKHSCSRVRKHPWDHWWDYAMKGDFSNVSVYNWIMLLNSMVHKSFRKADTFISSPKGQRWWWWWW